MALYLADSFEWATVTADLTDRGYTNADAAKITLDTTGGPDSDKALKLDNCGATDFFTMPFIQGAAFPTNGDPRIYFWIKTTVGYTSSDAADDTGPFLINLDNSASNVNIVFSLNENGGLSLYRPNDTGTIGTIWGDYSHPLNDGNWHRVEIHLTTNSPTGDLTYWVDGHQVQDTFLVDTVDGSLSGINQLRLGAAKTTAPGTGNGVWFKNIILWDDVGTEFTGAFGTSVVKMGFQQGQTAGTVANFTPSAGSNFQNIDEAPQDGDTTYNESSTSTHRDLFNYADAAESIDSIKVVNITTHFRNTDIGSISWRAVAEDAASVAVGASIAAASTSYASSTQPFYVNPNTTAAYTKTNLNSSEFGYEVI